MPDPAAAMAALRAAFLVRGPYQGEAALPAYRVADVIALANHVSTALAHDLPTPDRADTATILDKWRRAVVRVREHTRDKAGAALYPEIRHFDTDLDAVANDLVTAHKQPGEVARYYCPWKDDFFTFERLHPEAV